MTPGTETTASITFIFGFCPGCKTLHRTDYCPEDNPPEEACICCEAIAVERARGQADR